VRRRLWTALVGTVAAALLLAGLGTFALSQLDAREGRREDLAAQADALSSIVAAVPVPLAADRPVARETLDRLRTSFDLNGIGLVVTSRRLDTAIVDLPEGVELEDLDREALALGEPVTWRSGDLLVAADSTRTVGGTVTVVLTDTPTDDARRTLGWFLLSAAATLVLGMLVADRLGRALSGPVREAESAARRIAAGDLSARMPEDITAREDELGRLARSIDAMAASLDRARGLERQFLMSVSHDLRTPMTSIRGYAEALADGAAPDPARAGEVILAEAGRLERLVTDLLLLARLDARSFPLTLGPVDLGPLLDASVAGFAPTAAARGLTVGLEPVPTGTTVTGDPDRLAQVVANLVENACSFARRQVTVRAEPVAGWVHVTITDDGPGIAPDDLPHVFERLYVARRDPQARESGSGLGLAIVRELVGAMGGRVAVRSEPGAGTEFLVTLRAG